MKLSAICLLLAAAGESVFSEIIPTPKVWEERFGEEAAKMWSRLSADDEKVSSEEVIEEFNKRAQSIHDGDGQLNTAWALFNIEDDPIPRLRQMMSDEKPENRAFAVMVAGLLGDVRLQKDISGLKKDSSKLGESPGTWFWYTVSDVAKEALGILKDGNLSKALMKQGHRPASWLKLEEPEKGEQDVALKSQGSE